MKTQLTSILLCLLLCSTLGHDYHRAKQFAHESRSSKYLSHFRERVARPQQCEWICESSSNSSTGGNLQLIVNETSNLIGIVNITAEVAFILDINASLVAVFNGSSGAVIVVNIQNGSGVYIAPGESTSVWLSANESFEVYFSSLTSLQVIVDLHVGTPFNASTISTAISQILGNILSHLSNQIRIEIQRNYVLALTILLRISSSFSAAFNGSLRGILQLFRNGAISIHGDILWLVSVIEGLAAFFSEINGGLAGLIRAGVRFDIALLLRAADGFELLVNILLAIVARRDLSIISDLLNSEERFLSLIAQLGGNISSGVTGVAKIIAQFISVINGHTNLNVLIRTLLEYAASGSSNIDISISVEGLRRVIEIQGSLHSSSSLSGFISFIEHLRNGTLIIGRVNISSIINILVRGAVNGAIDFVVSILLVFSVVISPVVTISSLFLELLHLLNSTAGIHLLEELIPGLSIHVSSSNSGDVDIIREIFRGANIGQIIRLLTSGNITAVLSNLPIVSEIYGNVSLAITRSSNSSLSLTNILSSSGARSIIVAIRSFIRSSLNISGGISHHGGSGQQGSTRSWHWSLGGHHHEHAIHTKSGHNNKLREKHHQQHH